MGLETEGDRTERRLRPHRQWWSTTQTIIIIIIIESKSTVLKLKVVSKRRESKFVWMWDAFLCSILHWWVESN